MPADFLKVADRLVLSGVAGVKHRGDHSGLPPHILKALDVLNYPLSAGVHAAGNHWDPAGTLIQGDSDGPVPLLLGQCHAFPVGAAHKDAMKSVVDAVIHQSAKSRFVHTLLFIHGGDNRRNYTNNFFAHTVCLPFCLRQLEPVSFFWYL